MNYHSVSLEGAMIVTSRQRSSTPSFWAKHPTRPWVQVTFPKSEVGIYDVSQYATTGRNAIQGACAEESAILDC